MIKVKVKYNLKFPELALQEDLLKIAEKVILPDIGGRMDDGVDLRGAGHPSTSDKWRERKLKIGLRADTPLIASGQLRKSMVFKPVGQNKVAIYPTGSRKPYPRSASTSVDNNQLADILQNRYNFFGISESAERAAMDYMVKSINKKIDAYR